ncbi:MAG: T9SS type A sorting domain-containing protein [Candidatus Marinimicrobia bacterium]|nr:T9SS type A sorting domain-containing protein [Candidatus Neomarinimicrobiota bacterium]
MKIKCLKMLVLSFMMVTGISAQTPDLVLQESIDTDYVNYLNSKESEWEAQVAIGGDDASTMKAYIGLAALSFAWTHIDADTAFGDLDLWADSIETNLDSIFTRIEDDIIPMLDPWEMNAILTNLTGFFDSGDYESFRDFINDMDETLGNNFENVGLTLEDLGDDIDDNFMIHDFGHNIDSVYNHIADFEFSLQILANDISDTVFVIDRELFDHFHDLSEIGDSIAINMENFGDYMDSIMMVYDGDVMPGISELRIGLNGMTDLLDTVRVIFENEPFGPFEINTAPIDSLQSAIAELDTLLGGKAYEFGPDAEGKTIVPLAIIQNLPEGQIVDVYWDFYRSSTPETFTFGGIFPDGMDAQNLDLLSADLVMNNWDEDDALDQRMAALRIAWEADLLLDPTDPDAHLGLAGIMAYDMVDEYSGTFDDIFRLLEAGRIDSLTYLYDWQSVDFFGDLEEVQDHMSYFTEPDNPAHFVMLVKTELDAFGPYIIGPSSEFEIVHIPWVAVAALQVELEILQGAAELIVDVVTQVYDNLDEIFVLNLDPSVLDFSSIEDEMDLILMLEESNPNFLTLTDYGVEQFIQLGDDLEEALSIINEFFELMVGLANAMQPYDSDFGIDGFSFVEDMEEMETISFDLWQDFAFPDSMVWMDDERVNFSAWFDNPPTSFLLMWRGQVFGNDLTWGGLFPDRFVTNITPEPDALPMTFKVYAAYPNPFNPVTNIRFDLPSDGMVNVSIFNIRGQLVETLVKEELTAGHHNIPWTAARLPSNLYFYRVQYDGHAGTNKVLLIK